MTPEQVEALRSVPLGAMPNRMAIAMRMMRVVQVDLATGTGFSQATISDIENGNYKSIKLDTARNIAKFFGCEIDDLFPAREAVAS